jgi:hypothetical protein
VVVTLDTLRIAQQIGVVNNSISINSCSTTEPLKLKLTTRLVCYFFALTHHHQSFGKNL